MPDERVTSDPVARWRAEVRRALPDLPQEIQEELAVHAAERWSEARAAGLDHAGADARARRELTGWDRVPSPGPGRPVRWWHRLSGLGLDVRLGRRALAARPGSTLASVALVAIGVGASVTTFALAYGLLWRPLPYPDADRLAVVWQVERGEAHQVTYPDYVDFSRLDEFERAAALIGGRGSVRVGDEVRRVNALQIEPTGYALLGASPAAGRLLTADDSGRPVALVSHRFWRQFLSSDPAAVGRTFWMSGTTYTVVGVLGEGFDFELPVTRTFRLEDHDIWLPFDASASWLERRDVFTYQALLRLRPDATFDEAQVALDGLGTRLAADYPATNTGRSFQLEPLSDQLVSHIRPALFILLAAAAVTLVMALANLATLTLVALSARRGEMAVREALGASPWRLRVPRVIEHLGLAAAGTAVGVLVAAFAVRALASSEAANLPRPDALRIDAPVLTFALAVGFVAVIVLSLLPHGSGARAAAGASPRVSAASRLTRTAFVPIELAVALTLSTTGILLALNLIRLLTLDPGFSTDGVAVARVSAYAERYPDRSDVVGFFDRVTEAARSLPGVSGAAASSSLPLGGQETSTAVVAFGRQAEPDAVTGAGWQMVTPGYFEAAGVAFLAGADFTPEQLGRAEHVVIVSASLARELFGVEDPLGRRISLGGDTDDWHEIVGVVNDVRHTTLATVPQPRAYDLLGQHWGRTMYVVSVTDGDAAGLIPILRRTVGQIDPEAPVFETATMADLVARSVAARRLAARVAGGLAGVAIVVAVLGVAGIVATSVVTRTREFGVRLALGASPTVLQKGVVREQAVTLAIGGAMGLAGSVFAARLLGSQLVDFDSARAVGVIALTAVALTLTSLAAAFVPARRTGQVDPVAVLRA